MSLQKYIKTHCMSSSLIIMNNFRYIFDAGNINQGGENTASKEIYSVFFYSVIKMSNTFSEVVNIFGSKYSSCLKSKYVENPKLLRRITSLFA